MMIRNVRNLALATLSSIATLTGGNAYADECKPAHVFETIKPGVLVVAAYEFPPYSFTGPDKSLTGVDGEVVKLIAQKECLKVEPLMMDPAATIQYVVTKRADVAIGDWYRTAERARIMGLSAPLYLDQMGLISKAGYTKVEEIKARKVGTVQGSMWVKNLQDVVGANLKSYPNPVAMAQDLSAGRIEVAVDSYAVGRTAQAKGSYQGAKIEVAEPDERIRATIQAGQATLPHDKANTGLRDAMNADIEDLRKTGKIADILTKFGLDAGAANVGEPRLIE